MTHDYTNIAKSKKDLHNHKAAGELMKQMSNSRRKISLEKDKDGETI